MKGPVEQRRDPDFVDKVAAMELWITRGLISSNRVTAPGLVTFDSHGRAVILGGGIVGELIQKIEQGSQVELLIGIKRLAVIGSGYMEQLGFGISIL